MPVLDATCLIDMRRHPARMEPILRRAVEMEEDLLVPIQAAIEFAAGEKDPEAAMAALASDFTLAELDEPIARVAARIAKAAMRKGRFPGWADVQVAATAIHEGMLILTRNPRHVGEALGARVWNYAEDDEPPE